MQFLTVDAMKALEAANNSAGLSYQAMMNNAGREAARIVMGRYSPVGRRVLVLCGRGNNGGDGFVSAVELAQGGAAVTVALPLGPSRTPEALEALVRLEEHEGIPVLTEPEQCIAAISGAELILDCLFGTGFRGEPDPQSRRVMDAVNQSGLPVVAYDIPSGVEADTGRYSCCIPSELTIAFEELKPAHLVHWRGEYQSEVVTAPIGTPEIPVESPGAIPAVDREFFAAHRPRRPSAGHKGDNGYLTVMAGSRNYPGAAVLACSAALRAGVGYVQLVSAAEVCRMVVSRHPEVICTPWEPDSAGALPRDVVDAVAAAASRADALVIGCGLGTGDITAQLVRLALTHARGPVVLDADGLNLAAAHPDMLELAQSPLILTPHPGEFCRLFGAEMEAVLNKPFYHAQTMAVQYATTLLLKGAFTVLCGPRGQTMASFMGTGGLARAGSGDTLSGLIGAMAARGLAPMDAAACGLYLHGRAAELATERLTAEAMLPTDLVEMLPEVFKAIDN